MFLFFISKCFLGKPKTIILAIEMKMKINHSGSGSSEESNNISSVQTGAVNHQQSTIQSKIKCKPERKNIKVQS
jgi:hypothetical protein